MDDEGLKPEDVILVVNGEGGVENDRLESRLDVLRLRDNVGPAMGFRAGLEYALARRSAPWVYVMEDDVGLLGLPAGRASRIIHEIDGNPSHYGDAGAVVAYGRTFVGRTGRTVPHVPDANGPGYVSVDVAAWGATLIRRAALEAGNPPDGAFFFGYEDFDFFLRIQHTGWRILVDTVSELAVAHQVTDVGRSQMFEGLRPTDVQEPWREYYRARNFIALQRRWGTRWWALDHFLRSARRWQLSGWQRAVGLAILRGLSDGLNGRMGPSDAYRRQIGEYQAT